MQWLQLQYFQNIIDHLSIMQKLKIYDSIIEYYAIAIIMKINLNFKLNWVKGKKNVLSIINEHENWLSSQV